LLSKRLLRVVQVPGCFRRSHGPAAPSSPRALSAAAVYRRWFRRCCCGAEGSAEDRAGPACHQRVQADLLNIRRPRLVLAPMHAGPVKRSVGYVEVGAPTATVSNPLKRAPGVQTVHVGTRSRLNRAASAALGVGLRVPERLPEDLRDRYRIQCGGELGARRPVSSAPRKGQQLVADMGRGGASPIDRYRWCGSGAGSSIGPDNTKGPGR